MTNIFHLQLFADGDGGNTPAEAMPDSRRKTGEDPSKGLDFRKDRESAKAGDERSPGQSRAPAAGEQPEASAVPEAPAVPEPMQRATSLAAHVDRLMREAEELKRSVPDFDLWRELENSDFARLTNPASRVSVRAAYYAVHHDEINSRNMRAAAEAAAAETANRLTGAFLSASRRPRENGSTASAASLETVDWRTASRQHLIAQRRAILAAAARGETIYPKG